MASVKSALSLVPAAAVVRDIAPAEPLVSPLNPDDHFYDQPTPARVINRFVDAMGGKEAIASELLTAIDSTPVLDQLVQLSLDPRFDGKSFGWLCAKAGITPGEVFLAFRDVLQAKATVQAMYHSSTKLVEMLQEIVGNAITHEETCQTCRGTTTVLVRRKVPKSDPPEFTQKRIDCITCQATGKVVVPADREYQHIVLDLVGITKRQAGVIVNNQQNTQTIMQAGSGSTDSAAAGGLAQLQQAVSGILFGREATAPLRASVVNPDTPAEPSAAPLSPPVEAELIPPPG